MIQDDSMLDIRQAAELLRVSETSLRRWTKAGLLPCFRIGGRRERRFRRGDLLRLLDGHELSSGADAPPPPTETAVSGHVCGFYSSEEARIGEAVRFMAGGLASGGMVFLAALPPVRDAMLEALGMERPSLRDDLAAARLVPTDVGKSLAGAVMVWKTQFELAEAGGARSVHVVGDLLGAGFANDVDFEDILAYEAAADRILYRGHGTRNALCLYDARRLNGTQVAGVLHVHPGALRLPMTA